MDRPSDTPSGFRPTDTVALSTVERLVLYQQARRYGWCVAALGFLLLVAGGVFSGLMLHAASGAWDDRMLSAFLAVGLGGSGMSLLWMRRHSWPVLAALWGVALVVAIITAVFRA